MLKIAICDDEKIMLKSMQELLESYTDQNGIHFYIDSYLNGHTLIKNWNQYDIVFLDMNMPGLDGMDVAKVLREDNRDCKIVFVTSSQEMVFKAFEVNAFRYVLKPLDQNKLFEVLDAARNECSESDNDTITFEVTQKRVVKLATHKILFIEIKDRKTKIHSLKESFLSNDTLSQLEKRLNPNMFIKPHASFIVNLEHVKTHTNNEITLVSGETIPISRLNLTNFKKAFIKSLGL